MDNGKENPAAAKEGEKTSTTWNGHSAESALVPSSVIWRIHNQLERLALFTIA